MSGQLSASRAALASSVKSPTTGDPLDDLGLACRTIQLRRLAAQLVRAETKFEEGSKPWLQPLTNIMLWLYAESDEPRSRSAKGVSWAARLPVTTSVRYQRLLLETGFAVRESHPGDMRISILTLTPEGVRKVEQELMKLV